MALEDAMEYAARKVEENKIINQKMKEKMEEERQKQFGEEENGD